jgi:hypothetical protein
MDQSSTMESWSRLKQKIILLHHINDTPEPPSENCLHEQSRVIKAGNQQRSLTLREERRLSEAFALLAANSDDPARVAAACVEEHRLKQLLTVKLSVNKGELNAVKKSLDKIALILQRISRQC